MSQKDPLPVPEFETFTASCSCTVRIHCQTSSLHGRACVLYTQLHECPEREMGRVVSLRSCKLEKEVLERLHSFASRVKEAGWTLVAAPSELGS